MHGTANLARLTGEPCHDRDRLDVFAARREGRFSAVGSLERTHISIVNNLHHRRLFVKWLAVIFRQKGPEVHRGDCRHERGISAPMQTPGYCARRLFIVYCSLKDPEAFI